MKIHTVVMLASIVPCAAYAVAPQPGLYQTIDDKTNVPKSIVALYEYNADGVNMMAGRVVALYGADGNISETLSAPKKIADGIDGNPKYVGMDIIWTMKWDADADQYNDGRVMDPTSGKVYSSLMWMDVSGMLNVRGKLGPFGRTQRWNVLNSDDVPAELRNLDTKNWTPIIRK